MIPNPSFRLLVILLFIAPLSTIAQTRENSPVPRLGESSIKQVVKAMTLEEKTKLVVGNGLSLPGFQSNRTKKKGTPDQVSGAAGTTCAIPRLGIPSLVFSDGPAGIRIDPVRQSTPGKTYYATAWPVATLLASSWDTALVEKVGIALGHEAKEYGIDIVLAPALNIHRNPLGGRNFEYFSEDPLISGLMAAALVNGMESNGVGTSIKHFAVNNQETNRTKLNAIVSERALREIYLRGFEIAVKKSQPWTVMSSYNLVNGIYTSENNDLLTVILRDEWGFNGFVMTDWFGGRDPVAQMKASNEMLMPGRNKQAATIKKAVRKGDLSEEVLDRNIEKILSVMIQCPAFKNYKYSNQPDLKADALLSRQVASEGMVLLKNQAGTLPLEKSIRNVAVFGTSGYALIAGGTGSGNVNKAYTVSLVQGLMNAGYKVDEETKGIYDSYLQDYNAKHPVRNMILEFLSPTSPAPEMNIKQSLIESKARTSDVAIISIGRKPGEGRDQKVEGDYEFTETEESLILNVADDFHARGKKIIVVLNIGNPVDVMPWRDHADAILLAWLPGQEGGNAMADVLNGQVNPSGKLATTFPASYTDEPSAKNFPGKELHEKARRVYLVMRSVLAEVTYEEGIYIGYRYYNTFGVKPAYEFGYGLSYTQFTYSGLTLSDSAFHDNLTVSVTVTNTGNMPGKEVVQLYLSAPAESLDKPAEELKGFAKTALLNPGESQNITFNLGAEDLASFHASQSAWIADAGTYLVKTGASSEDIKLTESFIVTKDITIGRVNKALVPQTLLRAR